MSACLSSGGGGAAAYSFDLEKVNNKSQPSSSTTTTRATSPSSTISESSNSPLAISTRKPRTARKRPNQTYNEAAALLSTAYPNLFSSSFSSSSSKKKTHFYPKSPPLLLSSDNDDGSDLLLESIEEPDFLFHPTTTIQPKYFQHKKLNSTPSGVGGGFFDVSDEFDAESILDEEIEEGIDSIMANFESKVVPVQGNNNNNNRNGGRLEQLMMVKNRFNYPLGLGLRSSLRENDEKSWCTFHSVDIDQISPRIPTVTAEAIVESETIKAIAATVEKSKKKKKKKVAVAAVMEASKEEAAEGVVGGGGGRMLKLDYDSVLEAWSDKASPFSDEILGSEVTGADVNARLAQIDLFGDSGMREASVLRYKEKRRTRLFSKKIRYQVRKLNADQRPRMKGRFVRRSNASSPSGER